MSIHFNEISGISGYFRVKIPKAIRLKKIIEYFIEKDKDNRTISKNNVRILRNNIKRIKYLYLN